MTDRYLPPRNTSIPPVQIRDRRRTIDSNHAVIPGLTQHHIVQTNNGSRAYPVPNVQPKITK